MITEQESQLGSQVSKETNKTQKAERAGGQKRRHSGSGLAEPSKCGDWMVTQDPVPLCKSGHVFRLHSGCGHVFGNLLGRRGSFYHLQQRGSKGTVYPRAICGLGGKRQPKVRPPRNQLHTLTLFPVNLCLSFMSILCPHYWLANPTQNKLVWLIWLVLLPVTGLRHSHQWSHELPASLQMGSLVQFCGCVWTKNGQTLLPEAGNCGWGRII